MQLFGKLIKPNIFSKREGNLIPNLSSEWINDSIGSRLKLSNMSHLTVKYRYSIFELLEQGFNHTAIAKATGKDKSVISRELKRNSDVRSGV